MALSKEQWADIEQQLSGLFGRVTLTCDGYQVTAVVERIKTHRQGIVIYVDGYWRGEWTKGECEEARKFLRATKHYLHSAAERAKLAKDANSRRFDAEFRKYLTSQAEAHFMFWSPYWTNAKDFCRHIRKTCSSIELRSEDVTHV